MAINNKTLIVKLLNIVEIEVPIKKFPNKEKCTKGHLDIGQNVLKLNVLKVYIMYDPI